MPVWSPKFSSVASHGAGRLLLDVSLCMNLYVLYQKCRRWVLQMLLLLLLIVAYCMLLVACCVLLVVAAAAAAAAAASAAAGVVVVAVVFPAYDWNNYPIVYPIYSTQGIFEKMMSQPRMWMSHVKSQSISTNFQRSGTRVLVDPRVCFRVS